MRKSLKNISAEGRNRTDTSRGGHWILSPARLPVSPPRHIIHSIKTIKIYIKNFNDAMQIII